MTSEEKNKLKEDSIIEEMIDEINEIETEQGDISEEKLDEINQIQEDNQDEQKDEKQDEKCRDILARTIADFDNFKKRTQRDRDEMIFFLKGDIFKKILPRLDDLERIIKNTPEEFKNGALFEGILSIESKLVKDLENMGVKAFNSIGNTVDPDKHDVMTTVAGKKEGIIFDEFEKGYMLGDKVLRHAKVIVGA